MPPFWNISDTSATAIVKQDGTSLTYSQLYSAADCFAEKLAERSLLLIQAANNLESVISYIACLRNNHVAMLVSRDMSSGMLETLKEIYTPDYVYAPNQNGSYELNETPHHKTQQKSELHPELAVLLSTSGSTGSPKLVRLTRNNLAANAADIAEYLRLSNTERAITNLPLFYSYGLSIINSHLLVGATLLLTEDSLISPSFWNFYDEYEATSLAGVPYTYEMLELVGFRNRVHPHLRYMTQAGGHMPEKLVKTYAQWALEKGILFYVMYGQTEATARMSYLPPGEALLHPDSIGVAIPNGKLYLVDENNRRINKPGSVGELVYNGNNVCMGYAETRADLAKEDENNGILKTGDLAKFDSNGLFYITGRLKRFLKIAGNRFGLDELESQFNKAGIFAICGGTDGKLLVAVTSANDVQPAADFLKNTWHLMKKQYRVIHTPKIPRTESGKILYAELFQTF